VQLLLFCTKSNKCTIISQIITIIIVQNKKIKKTMKSLPASSVTRAHTHARTHTHRDSLLCCGLARDSHMIVAMHISYDTQTRYNSCYKMRQLTEYMRSLKPTHSILVREYATGLCVQHQYMTNECKL
jgi:hypothetical protein